MDVRKILEEKLSVSIDSIRQIGDEYEEDS